MNICVFTGTRAEYGLLKPLMDRISKDDDLNLSLVVSGAHLSKRHGHTVDTILEDGFMPDARIPLPFDDDSALDVVKITSAALEGIADALATISPDILLLLGDRYETFACAVAAAMLRIPVAHLHGGETTQGAMDEYFRHSITKMAHLHFTSCEKHRKRVIQMGEHPDTVFNVGAVGVEIAKSLDLPDKSDLESDMAFMMGSRCLLTTFHPVTLEGDASSQAKEFFDGLSRVLDADTEVRVILTGANADPGGSLIDKAAAAFGQHDPERVHIVASLGQTRYLAAMKHCAAVVGNSSSGIIEAPSFGVPTVNVGNRQRGREQATSILNCEIDGTAIARTVLHALSPAGRAVVNHVRNPYEKYGTSRRVVGTLKATQPSLMKTFYDITFRPGSDEQDR